MPLNIDWQQILLHLFNFLILFAGLYVLLYAPVKKFMKKREDYYREEAETSAKLKQEALETKKEYDAKMAGIEAEIAERRKAAATELDEMRVKREEDAEKSAAKIIKKAEGEAEIRKAEIVGSARTEIAEMLDEAAEHLFINAEPGELYDKFLDSAERSLEDGRNNEN